MDEDKHENRTPGQDDVHGVRHTGTAYRPPYPPKFDGDAPMSDAMAPRSRVFGREDRGATGSIWRIHISSGLYNDFIHFAEKFAMFAHGNTPTCNPKICPEQCGQKHTLNLSTSIAWEIHIAISVYVYMISHQPGLYKPNHDEAIGLLSSQAVMLHSIVHRHKKENETLFCMINDLLDLIGRVYSEFSEKGSNEISYSTSFEWR